MNTETTKLIHILLIEDNTGDARLIQEEFKDVQELAYTLEHVTHLQAALDYLSQHEVDVILSDLSLPDSPGMETFKRLQAQAAKIPVVVLTGFDNESMALNAVREGAQDYLIKGQVDGRALSRTILYAIERHRSQSTLRNLSLTDELTKLYNRRGFMTLGEQALKSAARVNSPLVLFYCDLDGLKQINDTHGHPEGDRAITGAAEILKKTFRQADVVARMGGDEFAILAGLDQTGGHEILMSRLRGNLAQYNLQNPGAHRVGLSVGLALFDPTRPSSITDLIRDADRDLYEEKKKKGFLRTPKKENKRRIFLLLLLLLSCLGLYLSDEKPPAYTPVVVSAPVQAPAPAPAPKTLAKKPAQAPKRTFVPDNLEVHAELIPKDVTIVRFGYNPPLNQPGDVVPFNIVGSGFTQAFQKTLTAYSGSAHVQVRNLRLVTINQIQGEFVIHPSAPTQYVYPYVLLNEVPVFKAAAPFAIIRPGEVLDIVFTRMDADGKGGRFRSYVNFGESDTNRYSIQSDVPGITVTPLAFKPPYIAEGTVRIALEVARGNYDLIGQLDQKEVFRKEGLIQVIRPTMGKNGFIEGLKVSNSFVRPGDSLQIRVEGRGFEVLDAAGLVIRVAGMKDTPLEFVGADRMQARVTLPLESLEGQYDVNVARGDEVIFPAKKVFTVVSSNWIQSIRAEGPIHAQEMASLEISGRDISPEFAQSLELQSDEPGLHLLKPLWVDANTVHVDMKVDNSVRPGQYLLQILSQGKTLALPQRPIITVQPTP